MTGYYVEVKKPQEWLARNVVRFDDEAGSYLPGDKRTPKETVYMFPANSATMKKADDMGCLPVQVDHWRRDPNDPPTLRIWWNREDFAARVKKGPKFEVAFVPYELLRKHSRHLPPMT